MTNDQLRDTLRQMIKDWNAATPAQRQAALDAAARRSKQR